MGKIKIGLGGGREATIKRQRVIEWGWRYSASTVLLDFVFSAELPFFPLSLSPLSFSSLLSLNQSAFFSPLLFLLSPTYSPIFSLPNPSVFTPILLLPQIHHRCYILVQISSGWFFFSSDLCLFFFFNFFFFSILPFLFILDFPFLGLVCLF